AKTTLAPTGLSESYQAVAAKLGVYVSGGIYLAKSASGSTQSVRPSDCLDIFGEAWLTKGPRAGSVSGKEKEYDHRS
ncbi:MAG: hypothetical protein DMG05_28290, partial [Acidobacteria bacterium]